MERLVELIGGDAVSWVWWARTFYVGEVAGTPVGVVWAAPGAPLAVQVMEKLIACGTKAFIGAGSWRGVHPSVKVDDILIPTAAVRDEGTSYHYDESHSISLSQSTI
jgi:uridine phosphorylase